MAGLKDQAAASPLAPAVRRELAKADARDESAIGYRASQSQNYATQTRNLNGRAFYQNGRVWTDSTAQGQTNLKQINIKFNSDAYFALLTRHPSANQWLSLGNNLDLVIDGTLYQIRDGES